MSIFNLDSQNKNLDNKIVAGLERLSQVFRTLLWEKAKTHGLSPIQIQLLIFIQYHTANKTTISYLAKEFNLTKPTISDAIKSLNQKKLIEKCIDGNDSRSYTIQLTEKGKNVVSETEDFPAPLTGIIAKTTASDKEVLWKNITNLIVQLNQLNIIDVQRTCLNCTHHAMVNNHDFCTLINTQLETKDIRIDCPEFEV